MINKILIIVTIYILLLGNSHEKQDSEFQFELSYNVHRVVSQNNGKINSSVKYINKIIVFNDSMCLKDCSANYNTIDGCFTSPNFKYFKKEKKIFIAIYKSGMIDHITAIFLGKKDTIYIHNDQSDALIISNLTNIVFEEVKELKVLNEQRECYVFKMCNFGNLKQGNISILYLDKQYLVPIKMEIKSYNSKGESDNKIYALWEICKVKGEF